MNDNKLIYIGKIIGVFGIKGELKVYTESDFVEYRFRVGAKIYLKNKKEEVQFSISSMRIHKNNVLITIDKLYDINMIEKYNGYEIYASSNDVPPLEDDEYQLDELIDYEVYNDKNIYLGLVKDFIEVPQGYIMEINGNKGKLLIPFVDEYIIEIEDYKIIIKDVDLCQ